MRFAGHHDDQDPRVVRAIGLWATGRRLKWSIRQMLARVVILPKRAQG